MKLHLDATLNMISVYVVGSLQANGKLPKDLKHFTYEYEKDDKASLAASKESSSFATDDEVHFVSTVTMISNTRNYPYRKRVYPSLSQQFSL